MADILFNKDNYHEFDPNFVEVKEVKVNNYKFKTARLLYKGKNVVVETPRLLSPFGMNVYCPDQAKKSIETDKYSIMLGFKYRPLSIDNKNINMEQIIASFETFMRKLDTVLKEKTLERFTDFGFNEQVKNIPDVWMTSCITQKRNEKTNALYDPTFRINIPFYNDACVDSAGNKVPGFATKFYDGHACATQPTQRKQAFSSVEEVIKTLGGAKGYQFKCIISVPSIQIVQSKARLNFVAPVIKFFEPEASSYMFSDSDEYQLPEQDEAQQAQHAARPAKTTAVEDSDDEDERKFFFPTDDPEAGTASADASCLFKKESTGEQQEEEEGGEGEHPVDEDPASSSAVQGGQKRKATKTGTGAGAKRGKGTVPGSEAADAGPV
jgi:hypothetical protein